MKLYEIHYEIEKILSNVDDNGELPDHLFAELDELNLALADKALDCAAYIKSQKAEAEAHKKEKREQEAKERRAERRAERVEQYLLKYIKPGSAFKDSRVAITWRESVAVNVFDNSIVPDELCRFQEKREPSKGMIRTEIENGGTVPGAVLEKRNRLRIK